MKPYVFYLSVDRKKLMKVTKEEFYSSNCWDFQRVFYKHPKKYKGWKKKKGKWTFTKKVEASDIIQEIHKIRNSMESKK